ncbi:MAG TPA: ArsR family transcriptional regulator [Patescibacteria group bacterium]
MLQDLFISKVRVKILQLLLRQPGQIYHVREIVRQISEEINAVRRELAHMEKAAMVTSEWRANRRYYSFRSDYLFFEDLLSMIHKTVGLGGDLVKNRNKLGRVKFAFISGSFVRGKSPNSSDVDLVVVGNVILPQLASIVKEEEARRELEINYTVMTEEEFTFRKRRGDPFIGEILSKSRVMLLGDEEEMLKTN